jgi:hypothetical protein
LPVTENNEEINEFSIEETVPKTAEMIKQELKDLKYQNYLINFKDRVAQWKNSNGTRPLPLHYDSEIGEWVWLNRFQRRFK